MKNRKIGLIGKKLSHSYSVPLHRYFGNDDYTLYPMDENEVRDFIRYGDYDGLNVTVPYKKIAYDSADYVSDIAKKTGSVNTIIKDESGKISGYNTDYFGFSYLCEYNKINPAGKKVLILGDGGSAQTINCYFLDCGASFVKMMSRKNGDYDSIQKYFDADIIVNATPVGMYPDTGKSLLDLSKFEKCRVVIDLIYNPVKTKLLLDAKKENIKAVNGLMMLCAQGYESAKLFSEDCDRADLNCVYKDLLYSKSNIVLCGMPGCGKTTIGRKLSELMNMEFADSDEYIEKEIKMTISEFFSNHTEKEFRQIEKECIKEIFKNKHQVVSLGGGTLCECENSDIIVPDSHVVYIKRDLNSLSRENRPLSKGDDEIRKLYEQRKDIYESICDYTVDNDSDADSVSERIKEILLSENTGN